MKLYQHQIEGILFALRRIKTRGALIAFEQGLGKTLTALILCHLLYYKGWTGKVLIVVPATLIPNWIEEAQRFIGAQLQVYHGPRRHRRLTGAKYTITSYETAALDHEKLAYAYRNHQLLVIGDEAHAKIQNADSKRRDGFQKLHADFTLLLTGTPISNKPEDLYSLVDIIDPALAGTKDLWMSRFVHEEEMSRRIRTRSGFEVRVPFTKIVGYRNLDVLHEMLSEIMIRRTKAECLDLPKKNVMYLPYQLSKSRSQYERFLEAVWDEREDRNQAIRKLQYLLSGVDPDTEHTFTSEKMSLLLDLLESTEHPVIVWCKYIKTMNHLKECIRKRFKERPLYAFSGADKVQDRHDIVNQFKGTEDGILLATIKAGGVGLNITEAKTCIYYEMEYTVSDNEQAEDRIHRIGQDQDVTIYYLYGKDTVEEGIVQLLREKSDTNNMVLTGRVNREKLSKYTFGVNHGLDYEDFTKQRAAGF